MYTDSRVNLSRKYAIVARFGTLVWSLLIHTLVFNSDLLSVRALIYLFSVFSHFVFHKPFVGWLKIIASELEFNGVNISVCYLGF